MSRRDYSPLDLFIRLESELRQGRSDVSRILEFHPRADVYETDSALYVKMEIAGVKPEALNITLSSDDRTLTVSGERYEPREEHQGRIRCHRLEIYFGAFEREIALPDDLRFNRDEVTASVRDGFLVITLPKREGPHPEKRSIAIRNE